MTCLKLRKLIFVAIALTTGSVIGCGESSDDEGSCVGVWALDGVTQAFPECYNNWTRAECDAWDEMQVNGTDWSFSEKTCQKRGYTRECTEYDFSYFTDLSHSCG